MKYGIGKKASYYLISKYKPNKNNNKKLKILDLHFIKKKKIKLK